MRRLLGISCFASLLLLTNPSEAQDYFAIEVVMRPASFTIT